MLNLLMCIAAFVVVLALAFQGKGYRGLYARVALIALGVGVILFWLADTNVGPAPTLEELAGAQFLTDYGTAAGGFFIVTAFACVVGALIFRTPKRPTA